MPRTPSSVWRMRARVDLDTVEPLIYKIALNLAASRRSSSKIWRWVSLEFLRDPVSAHRPADESLAARDECARLRPRWRRCPKTCGG